MVAVMPDCFVHMISKFFFPENCDIDLTTIWFQQVGLLASTAHQSRNTWRAMFEITFFTIASSFGEHTCVICQFMISLYGSMSKAECFSTIWQLAQSQTENFLRNTFLITCYVTLYSWKCYECSASVFGGQHL